MRLPRSLSVQKYDCYLHFTWTLLKSDILLLLHAHLVLQPRSLISRMHKGHKRNCINICQIRLCLYKCATNISWVLATNLCLNWPLSLNLISISSNLSSQNKLHQPWLHLANYSTIVFVPPHKFFLQIKCWCTELTALGWGGQV